MCCTRHIYLLQLPAAVADAQMLMHELQWACLSLHVSLLLHFHNAQVAGPADVWRAGTAHSWLYMSSQRSCCGSADHTLQSAAMQLRATHKVKPWSAGHCLIAAWRLNSASAAASASPASAMPRMRPMTVILAHVGSCSTQHMPATSLLLWPQGALCAQLQDCTMHHQVKTLPATTDVPQQYCMPPPRVPCYGEVQCLLLPGFG
jgi:hypothetical protein